MNVEATNSGPTPATRPAAAAQRLVAAVTREESAAGDAPATRPEDVQRAVAAANRAFVEKNRELTFEFDDDLGRVIVKLIDRKTGEVLRQVPSPELLKIARALETEAAGSLLRTGA